MKFESATKCGRSGELSRSGATRCCGTVSQPFGLPSRNRAGKRLLAFVLVLALGTWHVGLAQVFQELHAISCEWNDNTGWDCTHEGVGPEGALIQATDRNFYGTTTGGGHWGCGTVFKMTPDGALTTLASFDGTNGCFAYGALLQASDGNFYGTTMSGETGHGSLFKMTPDGTLTRLYRFDGWDGDRPLGDLAQGPDGKLYGVTKQGGPSGADGTIFRIATNAQPWELETLAALYPGSGPYYPTGGLLLANDGNFYGVTGGGYGTVYKMTQYGTVSLVAAFPDGPDGAAWPNGKLLEAPDGSFYGAADTTTHIGAIFRVTRDGMLTTVANFDFSNGEYPVGPLVLANDGNFYGSCHQGGTGYIPPQPCGTVFRMTPDGMVTGLVSFTGYGGQYSGAYPYAGLVQGSDGNLYGTTDSGGVQGGGNIFRLIMPGHECSLTCPANITICNDPGQCGAVVHFATPVATNCEGFVITCVPPSGAFFPVGTNTVLCAAVDLARHATNTCSFQVTVHDCDPPLVSCQPVHKPSYKRNAKSGRGSEREEYLNGFYQLLAHDNCDSNPRLYIQDSASGFLAGPFANGDIVQLTKNHGRQNLQGARDRKNVRPPIVASLRLRGNGLLYGIDASGNVGASVLCTVPHGHDD